MEFREIIKGTKIDFIGMRNKMFIFSAILVLLGIIGFIMVSMGKANLSEDFTGGANLLINFNQSVNIGELRSVLTNNGIHDVQIQQVSGTNQFFIKTKISDTEKEKVVDKIQRVFSNSLQDKKYEVLSSNMVGPAVGKTLKRSAIVAVILSLIGIIIYIALRFNFVFGVAATIATFHDVLVMLGLFFVLGREMNILFITALLTIAGYSLTDTVVVYDRIRENMAKMKAKSDLGDVINNSINEVLSRTIITSMTVVLVIAALLVLGGRVLFDFSLALLIGVLIGTYSSIFVASPLIFLWRRKLR
ncbi:MAG TPA: protein translocase subunit SecF [Syntrophorhabdaceae bacterium]|nr:protein translocase subunit SecF [Syntrophorhabdaceae bacterium]